MSQQLRLLWRRAAAHPGLTLVSLLTLAVAVGANVAIFAVVNGVLRRPRPFPDSERLVLIRHVAPQLGPLNDLVVRHVIIFGYGHGLQRAIIDESQHRTPERLIMAQH